MLTEPFHGVAVVPVLVVAASIQSGKRHGGEAVLRPEKVHHKTIRGCSDPGAWLTILKSKLGRFWILLSRSRQLTRSFVAEATI